MKENQKTETFDITQLHNSINDVDFFMTLVHDFKTKHHYKITNVSLLDPRLSYGKNHILAMEFDNGCKLSSYKPTARLSVKIEFTSSCSTFDRDVKYISNYIERYEKVNDENISTFS